MPLLHRLFLDHDIMFYFKTSLKIFKLSFEYLFKYSLLSIPRISRDWAKYVELSVVRGNQIMTYTYHFGAK